MPADDQDVDLPRWYDIAWFILNVLEETIVAGNTLMCFYWCQVDGHEYNHNVHQHTSIMYYTFLHTRSQLIQMLHEIGFSIAILH